MAKSELKPGVKMSRLEKKALHRKNPTAVIPKGRRKYQSVAFKCKLLMNSLNADDRHVDWTAVLPKPELLAPGDGSVYGPSGCVSNPRRSGKTTALKEALRDQGN